MSREMPKRLLYTPSFFGKWDEEQDEDEHVQSRVARKFNAVCLAACSLVSLVLINSGRR